MNAQAEHRPVRWRLATWLAIVISGLALLVLALRRYLQRHGPVVEHHAQRQVSMEAPRALVKALAQNDEELQLPRHGVGLLFHRRYQADIAHPQIDRRELMQQIERDLPNFAPAALASFRKIKGNAEHMATGDEYEITIPGPWNSTVRAIDVTDDSFAFVTLAGSPQAGKLLFRLQLHPELADTLRFEILSWARSRDTLTSVAYHGVRVGKEVQKNVWIEFCNRVIAASGGQLLGAITVINEEHPFDPHWLEAAQEVSAAQVAPGEL